MVFPGGFMVIHGLSWFLVGFHGFQGGFIVYHDFWLVSMVFSRWFHGLSCFLVGLHGFVS